MFSLFNSKNSCHESCKDRRTLVQKRTEIKQVLSLIISEKTSTSSKHGRTRSNTVYIAYYPTRSWRTPKNFYSAKLLARMKDNTKSFQHWEIDHKTINLFENEISHQFCSSSYIRDAVVPLNDCCKTWKDFWLAKVD